MEGVPPGGSPHHGLPFNDEEHLETGKAGRHLRLLPLYLVAPDDRRDKVEQEILRPTFTRREKPLRDVCGFLSFSKLVEKAEGIRKLGIASSLRPDFLAQTAEYFKEDGG